MYVNSIDFFNLPERWSWREGLGDVTINMSLGLEPDPSQCQLSQRYWFRVALKCEDDMNALMI